jgi:capsular polysaccharide transport system permease protein
MTDAADNRGKLRGPSAPRAVDSLPVAANRPAGQPQQRAVEAEAPKPKIVRFPSAAQFESIGPVDQQFWRRHWLGVSAAVICGIPTLLVALYLLIFAADRYAVEVQFAVRSQEVNMFDASGVLGALGGPPPQTATDSYIATDYILSSDFVSALQERVGLRDLYSLPHIDFFSRITGREEIEYTTEYWQSMTKVYFDSTKGTVQLEVSAYRAEDALLIAENAVQLVGELVNRISEEARNDALRSALGDVERAEFRVRVLRQAMQEFRARERIADPVSRAGSAQELIASLQTELARIESEIASSGTFLADDAPSMMVMQSRKRSIEQQIDRARGEIDGSTSVQGGDVARMLSGFEELEVERQFAQQAYQVALASLEAARAEADRNQRYLAVFVQPRVPETAKYPEILKIVLTTLVFLLLGWIVVVLIYYGVREHAV